MARKPTEQQASCIEASKSDVIPMLQIEAGAGSGKTSTLEMVAEENPVASMYLAFNKVTATEATSRFPKHVVCRTTHSVAYAACGVKIAHKLSRPKGRYVNVAGTGSEIGKYFNMDTIELGTQEKPCTLTQAFMGLLVRYTVARFEQSADSEIGPQHIPRGELKAKTKAVEGVSLAYVEKELLRAANALWKARIDTASPVLATHDTYLKMYQLTKPVFHGFDILYVDEFQDTTPCVLDIVMNQQAHMKLIMVGDRRQAIYGWRGAVNAMQMVQCERRQLTKSFRFGQAVADVATAVLERDMIITGFEAIDSVVGMGVVDRTKPYTRLFRTNTALLAEAVNAINQGLEVAIEIDTRDFVKLCESAIALYKGDMRNVKHDSLLAFSNWDEAVDEAKFSPELKRIVEGVNSREVYRWIEALENHVDSDDPLVTFTTAHKSKGREWDQVVIENDFKSNYNEEGWVGLPEEEQNLLYVAVTRAKRVLDYNQTVVEYLERGTFYSQFEENEELVA